MNKSVILNLFGSMFPGTDTIEFNFVDEKMILTKNGNSDVTPLDLDAAKGNVGLLKDFLKIKDNINNIHIDIKNHRVSVTHTNGTKQL